MNNKTFQEIKKRSLILMQKSCDPQHCEAHLVKVENNAKKIVKILKMEKDIDLNLLGAACYLHDLAFTKYKPGFINYFREGKRVKKIVTKFLMDFKIPDGEKKIIINAVWKHTLNFPLRRLNKNEGDYAKILQDADILDMLSPERLLLLAGSAKKFFYYKALKIFSRRASFWTIRHIGLFLNYPELAKESWT